jgi:hypothetical protein
LLVFGGAEEESGATDIVDLAGDAFGVVIETGDETIGEKLMLRVSQTKLMFDISGGFLEVERREVIANGDALV